MSHQRPARSHSVKKRAKTENFPPAPALASIAELIEDGEFTIGMLRSIGCVATAADEDCTHAILPRGESLSQLLSRLDQAIDKAFTLGLFTDEINR